MSRKFSSYIPTLIVSLILVSGLVAGGILRKANLDNSSQELAIAVTEAIFVDGNTDPLLAHAHASLVAQYSEENLRKTLLSISEILGPLQLIESITGGANVSLIPFLGGAPTANYAIRTNFNEDIAPLIIEMLQEEGSWRFTAYRVDSPMLLN
ncbi:MAG: hypothetical protein OXU66_08710 [Gammaproteobacteria bacterium]|nr:hypothetical protein [Gammaproteobacteria bacterium]MDD9895494.1 hypothetical protein [Gammaproteobacteria bacterium]MDD9959011.1 hypothetical protein [Gammaproteobacteria bacterium]